MIYGYIRVSSLSGESSPIIQGEEITKYCAANNLGEPTLLEEPLGTSGVTTLFRKREKGKWLILNAQPDDTIIAIRLDRFGRNCGDILNTISRLQRMGVRIVILNLLGNTLDLSTVAGKVIVTMFGLAAEIETAFMRQRLKTGRLYWASMGYCNRNIPWGKKIVRVTIGGRERRKAVWDVDQLAIILELYQRISNGENIHAIAVDFWHRGLKDQLGRPWGKLYANPKTTKYPCKNKYVRFHGAIEWFKTALKQGTLPPPYDTIGATIKTPHHRFVWKHLVKSNVKPRQTKALRADWTAEQWLEDWKLNGDEG